jgi:hypothetical protein
MMEGGRLNADGNFMRFSTRSVHRSSVNKWARSRKKYCTNLSQKQLSTFYYKLYIIVIVGNLSQQFEPHQFMNKRCSGT